LGYGAVQSGKPGSPEVKGAGIYIIENWTYIEADFIREYGIDLMESLPGMSWRRFSILLKGLGPNSTFVLVNASKDKPNNTLSKKKDTVKKIAAW
jgi:hypothetical protein